MGTKIDYTIVGVGILLAILIGFEVVTYYTQHSLSMEKREMIETIQARDKEIVSIVIANRDLIQQNTDVIRQLKDALKMREAEVKDLLTRNETLLKANHMTLEQLKTAVETLRVVIEQKKEK